MPDSLSSSQCLGALRRFWCFLAVHQAAVSIIVVSVARVASTPRDRLVQRVANEAVRLHRAVASPWGSRQGFGIETVDDVRGVP